MIASDEDLKSYLGTAISDRQWGNGDIDTTVDSASDWPWAVAEGIHVDPVALKSIVKTLHYTKATWLWLNQREEWDITPVPHPYSPSMVQVAKFIEFTNMDGITYYASRKVMYLANQILEEEAASALYVLRQGLSGPIAPFSCA
jgi:hypothetical protein